MLSLLGYLPPGPDGALPMVMDVKAAAVGALLLLIGLVLFVVDLGRNQPWVCLPR